MTNMTSARVVLDMVRATDSEGATFVSDEWCGVKQVRLQYETYLEMGSPGRVTVTIEPGDWLNDDDVPDLAPILRHIAEQERGH